MSNFYKNIFVQKLTYPTVFSLYTKSITYCRHYFSRFNLPTTTSLHRKAEASSIGSRWFWWVILYTVVLYYFVNNLYVGILYTSINIYTCESAKKWRNEKYEIITSKIDFLNNHSDVLPISLQITCCFV